jgi:hypothetical protein
VYISLILDVKICLVHEWNRGKDVIEKEPKPCRAGMHSAFLPARMHLPQDDLKTFRPEHVRSCNRASRNCISRNGLLAAEQVFDDKRQKRIGVFFCVCLFFFLGLFVLFFAFSKYEGRRRRSPESFFLCLSFFF